MPAALLQFLGLPSELILECLVHLPYADMISCLKTGNRLLHDIITNSVLIRYRVEEHRACVDENPAQTGNSVVADRLAALRRREDNWLNFTPVSRQTLVIDFVTSGVYDLASDIYLVGDTPDPNASLCTAIKYIYISPGVEAPQWQSINARKPVIDFGTALEEHDLIAMVTYTPHDAIPDLISIDVLLLKFSTGLPHPLAANPTLHIHNVEVQSGHPGISIEIVGENLAISLVYWTDQQRDMDTLHIYNWNTGLPKMAPLEVNNTGVCFLTMDTLVVPNSEGSLDVYSIPLSEGCGLPRLIQSFYLPLLDPYHGVLSFQCRGDPNPRAAYTRPSRSRFLPRPDTALLFFTFEVVNRVGEVSEHMFIVDRPRLVGAIDARDLDVLSCHWDDWGPQCTRWLDAAAFSKNFITMTSGTRLAAIAVDAHLHPAPVRVLDFNPAHVRAQRAAGRHVVEADVEADAVAGTIEIPPFAEPIVSLLPYIETVSKELFTYAAVLINDENIIGAKFGDGSVEALEVLHFG
ncbi:hypothetical protein B0H17DRAFT_1328952 [Mycena rosella]|uniref:F-box domain-containing protein n=1 Tax=Mycena rosella TaxID=1033263 RepID=A0AAD7DRE2_MYCRO|nr:hypothetical protein B0H17DRAFT_1328952 [Mycena rosella]